MVGKRLIDDQKHFLRVGIGALGSCVQMETRDYRVAISTTGRRSIINIEIPACGKQRGEGKAEETLFIPPVLHPISYIQEFGQCGTTQALDSAALLDDEKSIRTIACVCNFNRPDEVGDYRLEYEIGSYGPSKASTRDQSSDSRERESFDAHTHYGRGFTL